MTGLNAAPAQAGLAHPMPRVFHLAVQPVGLSWRASCNMSVPLNQMAARPAGRVEHRLRCHKRGCWERWPQVEGDAR